MATRLTPSFAPRAAPETQPGSRARSSRRMVCSAGGIGWGECVVEMKSASRTLAQMSFVEFQRSIASGTAPPAEASRALQALWHDARGDWAQAHACAQEDR